MKSRSNKKARDRAGKEEEMFEEIVHDSPDHYRGDMCCVEPNKGYRKAELVPPTHGGHDARAVRRTADGALMGHIEYWYGSNGQGKLAESRFYYSE